ncbi:hypothetical protein HYR99_07065 [Candidatus Poribacteria bacterium]|nr:hypothetical protein [Candidatus Poribacteria bacterium]
MEYDALFKRLLKTFFRFFMELFFPQVAAQIQWGLIEFLDKEEHSNFTPKSPKGATKANHFAAPPTLSPR